jgi:tetratricopeptide (TPR) repeat protein
MTRREPGLDAGVDPAMMGAADCRHWRRSWQCRRVRLIIRRAGSAPPSRAIALLAIALALPVCGAAQSVPRDCDAQAGTERAVEANLPPGPGLSPTVAQLVSPADTLYLQAFYWASRDLAIARSSLERLLRLDRNNPAALALMVEVLLDLGMPEVANSFLDRLSSTAPGDPHVAEAQAAIQRGPRDLALLAQARSLAGQCQLMQALEAYRRFFRSATPPDIYAPEYYMVLQALRVDDRKPYAEEARDGMAALTRKYPDNTALRFRYALLLSYDEATRGDAADLFERLVREPFPGGDARRAWRNAILWQGVEYRMQSQLENYLRVYPTDPELEAKRDELRRSLPSEAVRARWAGYQALEAKNIAEAEKQFLLALSQDPSDADAKLALAVVRRQQGRAAESKRLVDDAIALDPARKEDFLNIMSDVGSGGGGGGGAGSGLREAEIIRERYARIRRLADQSDYAGAEAALRRLKTEKSGWYVQLASIQARAGRNAEAEASYRKALSLSPRDRAAQQGLARIEANQLRDRAAAADPLEKDQLLRQAIATDPSNPWTRLELARVLSEQNRREDADRVMAEVAANPSRDQPDQVEAAIIWANERNDYDRAPALLQAVPPKKRTEAAQELEQKVTVRAEIRDAIAGGDPALIRQRLLSLAAKPDPTGVRGLAIANALRRMGDKATMKEAMQASLAATPSPTSRQRLDYAGVLLRAGDTEQARKLIEAINPDTLDRPLRQTYRGISDGLAITESDRLNEANRRDRAYEALRPRLAREPESNPLNLAVGRLYQSDRRPREALRISQAAIERDPKDLDAKRSAVAAAVDAGNLRLARQISEDAAATSPADPRTYLMQATVARAQGRRQDALDALKRAKELQQQTGARDPDGPAP